MDNFTRQYIECALWTATDTGNNMGDYSVDDLDEKTLKAMIEDCENFQERAAQLKIDDDLTENGGGHDFSLTRNGHGAGFWDGDWEKEQGEKLTDLAHEYGEFNLYLGDDGKIYSY